MTERETPSHFIRQIIAEDNRASKWQGRVHTRFPPEPNGYLHVGHAKSICLNFGLAQENGGTCNLRFDDTNPLTENPEYVASIKQDVKWLGFDWGENLFNASDYFEKFYACAEQLITSHKAYVCDLSNETMREYRGSLTEPGKNSPYRDRTPLENLNLFREMRAGGFPDGTRVLRAKIDMASPNINLRDPVMYRIRRASHHATGDKWCIYPIYDYAHCISDSIEGITHSICTLEFEDHRPLYDWYLENLNIKPHPQQIEFARLELGYTITSKRKLKELVEERHVSTWDDPRMPTISGMRRRGYPPEALRDFCERIGVAKSSNTVDMGVLDFCVRDELERSCRRVLGVLKPIRVVIENYPEGRVEEIDAPYHGQKPELGTRMLPFAREIYIDEDDFMEEPPKGYFRLVPGGEVRLRYAYIIRCDKVIKDDSGKIIELRCHYDSDTLGKNPSDGRKVKGIVHWVAAATALSAEVRLYDRLFTVPNPTGDKARDYRDFLNPASLEVIAKAQLEPSLRQAEIGDRFQFERLGYFNVDSDSRHDQPVFNRIVTLRDSWAKGKS